MWVVLCGSLCSVSFTYSTNLFMVLACCQLRGAVSNYVQSLSGENTCQFTESLTVTTHRTRQ